MRLDYSMVHPDWTKNIQPLSRSQKGEDVSLKWTFDKSVQPTNTMLSLVLLTVIRTATLTILERWRDGLGFFGVW